MLEIVLNNEYARISYSMSDCNVIRNYTISNFQRQGQIGIISEIESGFFPQWLKKVPSPSDYVNIRTKWNILDHSADNVPAGWDRDRLYICGLYFPLISLCYNAKYYQISRWPEFLPWCHGNNLLLLHVKFERWTIVLGFQWYVRRLRKLRPTLLTFGPLQY